MIRKLTNLKSLVFNVPMAASSEVLTVVNTLSILPAD